LRVEVGLLAQVFEEPLASSLAAALQVEQAGLVLLAEQVLLVGQVERAEQVLRVVL